MQATTGGTEPALVNLADPVVHAEQDLTDLWRHLRSTQPVWWHPPHGQQPGFWVVTRHADVVAGYRDSARLSSQRGNVLATLLQGGDSAGGRMAPVTDGPRHAELRKLLASAFAPRALDAVARQVRATTQELLRAAVEAGDCDFARDVAAPIPLATTCDLLGVPAADRQLVLKLTSSALSSPTPAQTAPETWLARNEILLYFAGLLTKRRQAPQPDVTTLLATARVGGRPLSPAEIILNCYALVLGGDETTRLVMVGAAAALATHPDQWRRLTRGEVSVASAVEEVVRWTTPTLHAGRTASTEIMLRGRRIAAGDIVTLWNASANTDEAEFDAPGRFDLGRTPNRHTGFGYGPHFCLGAVLARIEIGALLTALQQTVAGIELRGEPRRIYSNFLSGFGGLPVRLTPA
jgi:cytochrome P450